MQDADQWQPRLRQARTEEDVVRVVLEYLQAWPQEERASFPCPTDPWLVRTRQHIAECAVDLTRAELDYRGDDPSRQKLAHVMAIFRDAVTRFSQLSQEARLLGPQSES